MANKMKTHVKWSPMDFPDRIKNHPEKLKEAKLDVLKDAKDIVVDRSVKNIERMRGGTYTREAVRSIMGEGTHTLTKVTPDNAVVGSRSISAIILEYGRRPGRAAPVSAIAPWAASKGITDPRVHHLIARAIGRRGIRGKFPIFRGLKDSERNIATYVRNATNDLVDKLGFR